MPEGPEIRRAADALAEAVVGRPLTLAWFAFPALKRHQKALVGHRIEAITPHGKALLTRFDHGWTLYSHNQLYGIWKIAAPGERPAGNRSLRVALETAERAILLYSASEIAMWRSDDIHAHPFLARLGPDVLDAGLDAKAVAARLVDARFQGRALGALLLDQAFLAGMGNYLRSEVLFKARLLPSRRPRDLSAVERRRLAAALLAIPRASYATRGLVAPADAPDAALTDTPTGFRFQVFDREGLPCPACGTTVTRMEHGMRRLYLCPACQH